MRKSFVIFLALFLQSQTIAWYLSSIFYSTSIETDAANITKPLIQATHTYISGEETKIWLPLVTTAGLGITFYVSVTGDNASPGSLERPFRTIARGLRQLAPGDTLYLRGGSYAEMVNIHISGAAGRPITIASYPGEKAVITGDRRDDGFNCEGTVNIYGSYITVENLEVTNPEGCGVRVWKDYNLTQTGAHATLRNLDIHDIFTAGIYAMGDDALIEGNRVWRTNLSNGCKRANGAEDACGYPYWSAALAFGDSSNAEYGQNAVVRDNEVHENYGEGILCMYTLNALIEGNRVWDNWAEGIYTDQCSEVTIRGNLSYYTTDREYWRFDGMPASGIMFSNEGLVAGYPIGHDLRIYNNIVVNAGYGIYFWIGTSRAIDSAAINVAIANNTVINNSSYGAGIFIDQPNSTTHQNTIIENNIVMVKNDPLLILSKVGLTFTHNLYQNPPSFTGVGDIIDDPKLISPSQSVDQFIDPTWYGLKSSSPAIGNALPITYINTDFSGDPRDAAPDIGACEY